MSDEYKIGLNNFDTEIRSKAKSDFISFWDEQAKKLSWFKPWIKTLDWNSPFAKWFVGGKINAMPGSNMPLATLGTFILWLGWFGFNGGRELIVSNVVEANAVALIFVNTNAAAAGGVIACLLYTSPSPRD